MSKITFRADSELIERIEEFDASKSKIMRDAIRQYLDSRSTGGAASTGDASATIDSDEESSASLDAIVAERVDELVERRLTESSDTDAGTQDVNVTVNLEGERSQQPQANARTPAPNRTQREEPQRPSPEQSNDDAKSCVQCGEELDQGHVYCPNCGEKTAQRAFCECGDELRSDWAFCPGCGRRTPSADILDRS